MSQQTETTRPMLLELTQKAHLDWKLDQHQITERAMIVADHLMARLVETYESGTVKKYPEAVVLATVELYFGRPFRSDPEAGPSDDGRTLGSVLDVETGGTAYEMFEALQDVLREKEIEQLVEA